MGFLSAGLYIFFSNSSPSWNPLEWGTYGILPFSFIFSGILIGIVHSRYNNTVSSLKRKNGSLKNKVFQLDKTNQKLVETNLKFEKKIVFGQQTFHTVYRIAEKLNSFQLDELYQNIPELVSRHLKARKCSFFLKRPDNSIVLKSLHGWEHSDEFPARYTHDDTLYFTLTDLNQTTVLGPRQIKALGIDGYFIVALITPEKNLFGMIKIEAIDFINVSEESIRFLQMLSNWIMQSIYNGLRFAEKEKSSAYEPGTGLAREASFWGRAQKVIASAVRHKFEVVLMMMKLNLPDDMDSSEKNTLISQMGVIINEVCRVDDELGIAELDSPYHFMILLAHTNKQQSCFVAEKIESKISNSILSAYNKDKNLYDWEILSFDDGTLFLSDIVQENVFNPLNSIKLKYKQQDI